MTLGAGQEIVMLLLLEYVHEELVYDEVLSCLGSRVQQMLYCLTWLGCGHLNNGVRSSETYKHFRIVSFNILIIDCSNTISICRPIPKVHCNFIWNILALHTDHLMN